MSMIVVIMLGCVLAAICFLVGLVGLIFGYFLSNGQILRGSEARLASRKFMLASLAVYLFLVLIGGLITGGR